MSVLLLLVLSAAEAEPAETAEPVRAETRGLPPVAAQAAFKGGRIELAPVAAFSFRDSFFKKYVVGAEAAWHVTDWLSLGGWGGYSITRTAGAAHVCTEAGCSVPDVQELSALAPGNLTFITGAEVQLAPFYGKLSFLAETFGNFDVHLRLGGALVGYQNPGLALAPGGRAGVGARFFLTRWLALRLDVDDLIYPERVKKSGADTTVVRNQLFIQAGFALFLGGGP